MFISNKKFKKLSIKSYENLYVYSSIYISQMILETLNFQKIEIKMKNCTERNSPIIDYELKG